MAYSKKTWVNDEVITDTALNNMEDGIAAVDTALGNKADTSALSALATKEEIADMATKTELAEKADTSALAAYVTSETAESTYAKTADLANKVDKGNIVAEAPAVAASTAPTKEEYDKLVAYVLEIGAKFNQ